VTDVKSVRAAARTHGEVGLSRLASTTTAAAQGLFVSDRVKGAHIAGE
jgi:hypothetical protein